MTQSTQRRLMMSHAFKFFSFTFFSAQTFFTILFFSASSQAMIRALHTAASGMSTQEANVNTISNNLANLNTTGFKKDQAQSEDLLYATIQEAGARSSVILLLT
jgi:hypothetical protein